MAKWQTLDVAEFTHDDGSTTTILGKVKCLLCGWSKQPTSQFTFPTIDDEVEAHLTEAHPEKKNVAGVQRAPIDDKLVYFVITNP